MQFFRAFRFFAMLAFGIVVSNQAGAQNLKEIFSNSEAGLFYFGIDFTQARLIDDADADVDAIRDRHLTGINEIIVNEPKKYDLEGAFHKSVIDHDLSFVNDRNESINTEAFLSTSTSDFHRLKEADIQKLVSGFKTGKMDKGVGLLFIVEGMSKSKKAMATWVTLFDIKTKKVLMTERMEGKIGMGFMWKNVWAGGIKSIIDDIDKKKYKEWKSKYAGS